MQSRLHSILEAVTNNVLSYLIGLATNFYVLPLFGFNVSLTQASSLTLIFAAISFVRQYLLRRLFNQWHGAVPK